MIIEVGQKIAETERTLYQRLWTSTLLCETDIGQKIENTERTLRQRLEYSTYCVRLKLVKSLRKLKVV